MDEVAARWRELFLETLEPYRKYPLLLSGGVDSGTILAGLLELGERPRCYAFALGSHESVDLKVAQKMCKEHDVPLTQLHIHASLENLERSIRRVISIINTGRKAAVQCSGPVLEMCLMAKDDGHRHLLVGTGAVCLDDRRVEVLLHSEGEEAAREYRAEKLNDKERPDCGTWAMHEVARKCGVPLTEPYSEEPIRSYGLSLDMRELNRPRQKGIALRAFPDFWRKGYWRKNSALQVNSGVREWHDQLLHSPLNVRGKKRVVAIYNDVLAGRV